jgi:hypothetical protein
MWSPSSWRDRESSQLPDYADPAALGRAIEEIRGLPPLVHHKECDRLRALLASAIEGKVWVLWAGDCAEEFKDTNAQSIETKFKVLLQMSLVLICECWRGWEVAQLTVVLQTRVVVRWCASGAWRDSLPSRGPRRPRRCPTGRWSSRTRATWSTGPSCATASQIHSGWCRATFARPPRSTICARSAMEEPPRCTR